ncbi:MAG: hypothetical protein II220_10895 [Spirochaetales bacterium]|nr:hypothetical protein [Spirochaetales bacterium]
MDERANSIFAKNFATFSKLKLLDPECGGSPEKYQNGFTFGYNASLETGIN